jgi:hypothetical protein
VHTIAGVVFTFFLWAAPAGALTVTDHVSVTRFPAKIEIAGLSGSDAAAVEDLWEEFVAGVPAHASCLLATPPRIVAKPDLGPRAAYAPSSGTLYVKPGDLPRLVVFHELAHHLDFTCGAAESVGEEFRAAQGISPSKPWWKDGDPVTWPAEYFANAVAMALGEESRHRVTAEALTLVEEWIGRTQVAQPVVPPVFIVGQYVLASPLVS